MKALVLSGGGAHGAYEAGVAKALLERESYDLICGVSIGAVNAALIAAGRTDDALERFWHSELPDNALMLFPHVPRLRRLLDHVGSLGSGSPWHDAVRVARAATEVPFLRKLGNVHKTSLPVVAGALGVMLDYSKLRVPLLIGATNATRARASVFRASLGRLGPPAHRGRLTEYHDLDEETFVMALLASAAMPGLFSPIELTFDGTPSLFADGCMVHTSPLGLAVDNGATEVTVVLVDQDLSSATAGAALGITDMVFNLGTLWQQRLLDYELRLAEATNEIVRLGGAPEKRTISIRYIRPEKPLELDMLAFDDAAALSKAFAAGMRDGSAVPQNQLPELQPAQAPRRESVWESLRRLFPRVSVKTRRLTNAFK